MSKAESTNHLHPLFLCTTVALDTSPLCSHPFSSSSCRYLALQIYIHVAGACLPGPRVLLFGLLHHCVTISPHGLGTTIRHCGPVNPAPQPSQESPDHDLHIRGQTMALSDQKLCLHPTPVPHLITPILRSLHHPSSLPLQLPHKFEFIGQG
jgi:hypothetical protein